MNIIQMRCFTALYNTGSFTKAAEHLYMTQPAISKNISSLEEELGTTLVDRKKGGKIQFTKSGEAYFNSFSEVLNTLDNTAMRVKYILSETKHVFRVGVMETWYIPDLILMCNTEVSEELGDTEFIFEFLSPGAINRMVENGKIDFIFTIDPAYENNKNYSKEHVVDIHSSIYTSITNPAVENGILNIDKLEPVLYMITQQQITHTNVQLIHESFYPRQLTIKEVYSGQSVFMNVSAGIGAAISDSWSLNNYSPLTVSFTQTDMTVPVIFAKKTTSDPFYNKVADFLLCKIHQWIEKKDNHL